MTRWLVAFLLAGLAIATTFAAGMPSFAGSRTETVLVGAIVVTGSLLASLLAADAIAHLVLGRFLKDRSTGLLKMVLTVGIFLPVVFLAAHVFLMVDLTAFLATSAIMSVAIGLALQPTLGNVFAGLALQMHETFRIGDWIVAKDMSGRTQHSGRVEEISWRAVSLRRSDRCLISVPNRLLTDQVVVVTPKDQPVRISTSFRVPLCVPPRRVIDVVEAALAGMPVIERDSRVEVLVDGFVDGEAAFAYLVRAVVRHEGGRREVSQVNERIWYALARAHIPFAGMRATGEDRSAALEREPLAAPDPAAGAHRHGVAAAVAACPLFAGSGTATLDAVAAALDDRVYGPGERIGASGERGLHLILAGLAEAPADSAGCLRRRARTQFAADRLDEVAGALAIHVGPVARRLVAEAAAHSASIHGLYDACAAHIPDEAARTDFLAARPAATTMQLTTGDVLGAEAALTGGPDGHRPTAHALSEVHAGFLSFERLGELLACDPGLATRMVDAYAAIHDLDGPGRTDLAGRVAHAHGLSWTPGAAGRLAAA